MPKGTGFLVFGLLALAAGIRDTIRGVGTPFTQLYSFAFVAVILAAASVDLFVVWLDSRVARHRALRLQASEPAAAVPRDHR